MEYNKVEISNHYLQSISPSERAHRFVINIRKLLFQLSADSHEDSAKAEKRLGKIPKGAGRIAGPIAFSAMGNIIYRQESITMGELTKELLIPPATTNRLVSWWVDHGLAERLSDPNDKRIIRVRITKAGRRFYETTQDIAIDRIKSFFNKLTSEEVIIFDMLFDKLTSSFDNNRSD